MEDVDDHPETLYDVLYCSPDATDTELRTAYKQQALHWHPDKNEAPEAEERFKLVNQAWSVLSDQNKRAAYDRSLQNGGGAAYDSYGSSSAEEQHAASVAREVWTAFMEAEKLEKERQKRRERRLRVGVCSLFLWVLLVQQLFWLVMSDSDWLYSNAIVLSSGAFAREFKLELDFKPFETKLRAGRRSKARSSTAGGGSSSSNAYHVSLELNRTTELRRAPEVGRPNGRGWLLTSDNKKQDIYGRELNLATTTFLFFPEDRPRPWPTTTLCVSLLRSGSVKQKDWWNDMSRAVGGRLRPFALAVVSNAECEPRLALLGIASSTALAVALTAVTVQILA